MPSAATPSEEQACIALLQNSDSLKRVLTVEFNQQDWSEAYSRLLIAKSKTMKFPGFRPGKVPMTLVEQAHKKELMAESWQATLKNAVIRQLGGESEVIYSAPNVVSKVRAAEDGSIYQFDVQYEVIPKIKPSRLSGRKLVLPQVAILDEEVQYALLALRYQLATYQEWEGAAQSGDRLVVSALPLDGVQKPLEHPGVLTSEWTVNLFTRELDVLNDFSGQWISFDLSDLLGIGQHETRHVKVSDKRARLPQIDTELPMFWAITAREVLRPTLPVLDPKAIRALGIEDGTEASLLRALKTQLQTHAAKFRQQHLKLLLMSLLQETHPDLPVPPSALKSVLKAKAAHMDPSGSESITENAQASPTEKELVTYSISDLQSAYQASFIPLCVKALVQRYHLSVESDELDAAIRGHSALYTNERLAIKGIYKDSTQVAQYHQFLLEEKVVQILKSYVVLDEPSCTLQQLFKYAIDGVWPIKEAETDLPEDPVLSKVKPKAKGRPLASKTRVVKEAVSRPSIAPQAPSASPTKAGPAAHLQGVPSSVSKQKSSGETEATPAQKKISKKQSRESEQ